LSKILYPG